MVGKSNGQGLIFLLKQAENQVLFEWLWGDHALKDYFSSMFRFISNVNAVVGEHGKEDGRGFWKLF